MNSHTPPEDELAARRSGEGSMNVTVADQHAAERLMQQIGYQTRRIDEPTPTRRQVAMVLHALADHTAIMEMVKYDRMGKAPQGEDPTKETRFWPTETSIARWLHDVGDDLEYVERKGVLSPTVKIKAEQPLQVNPKSHHYTEGS